MNPFLSGFSSELTKTSSIAAFVRRLEKSPELVHAIKSSTLLGAGTGALAGSIGDDGHIIKRLAKGAVIGAGGGAVTGAVYPGWFSAGNRLAADEAKKGLARRLFRK